MCKCFGRVGENREGMEAMRLSVSLKAVVYFDLFQSTLRRCAAYRPAWTARYPICLPRRPLWITANCWKYQLNPIDFTDLIYIKLAKPPENEIPIIPRLTLGIDCVILYPTNPVGNRKGASKMFIVNARMSGRMCMNMLYYAQMLPDRQNTKLLWTGLPDAARPCGFIAFSEAGSCELPAFLRI